MYIDSTYYTDTYKGEMSPDPNDLGRTIARAEDAIDILTNFKFKNGELDFETTHAFIKEQVKKATSALVEHYIINGGYNATRQTDVSTVSIGTFSYGSGSNNKTSSSQDIPELVFLLLHSTGLLYAGIGSVN